MPEVSPAKVIQVEFGQVGKALFPGSMIFVGLFVVSAILSFIIVRAKTANPQYKSDNGIIALISSFIAVLCMWIMWVCTYLAQMNPIIFPEVAAE